MRARIAAASFRKGPLPILPMYAYQFVERWRRGAPARDVRQIPVIINNFNRLESMLKLLAWLDKVGMRRVCILDNASTYPPLLEYYERCPYEVIYQGFNGGPYGFWESRAFLRFWNDYYIYTDPDVVPSEECPDDAVQHLYDVLRSHSECVKVGLGLKIDDLPDHYSRREEVIAWEEQYWRHPVGEELYAARVDSTFALYRPFASGGCWREAIRTGGAYQARHMPWYENSAAPSEEDEFYRAVLQSDSHWMKTED